jgi:hypothetical protein
VLVRCTNSTIKEFLNIPHFNFVDANMRPTDDESSSPLALTKPAAPDHAVVKSAFESVLVSPLETLFSTALLHSTLLALGEVETN